jgi:hypothetical protein
MFIRYILIGVLFIFLFHLLFIFLSIFCHHCNNEITNLEEKKRKDNERNIE